MAGKRHAPRPPPKPGSSSEATVPRRSFKIPSQQPLPALDTAKDQSLRKASADVPVPPREVAPYAGSRVSRYPPTPENPPLVSLASNIYGRITPARSRQSMDPWFGEVKPSAAVEDVWLREACASNRGDPWDSVIIRQMTREFNHRFRTHSSLTMMFKRLESLIGPYPGRNRRQFIVESSMSPPVKAGVGGLGSIGASVGDSGLSDVEEGYDTEEEDVVMGLLYSPTRVVYYGGIESSEEGEDGGEGDIDDDGVEDSAGSETESGVEETVRDESEVVSDTEMVSETEFGSEPEDVVGDLLEGNAGGNGEDTMGDDMEGRVGGDCTGENTMGNEVVVVEEQDEPLEEVGGDASGSIEEIEEDMMIVDPPVAVVDKVVSPDLEHSVANVQEKKPTRKRRVRDFATPPRIPRGVWDRFLRSDRKADADTNPEIEYMPGFNRSQAMETNQAPISSAQRTQFTSIEDAWIIDNYSQMRREDGGINWRKFGDIFELQFGKQRRKEVLKRSARLEIEADYCRT